MVTLVENGFGLGFSVRKLYKAGAIRAIKKWVGVSTRDIILPYGGSDIRYALHVLLDAGINAEIAPSPPSLYPTHWKLADLDLREKAADWYILAYLKDKGVGRHQADVEYMFAMLTNLLASQFARYLDLSIGGELRYAKGRSRAGYYPGPLLALRFVTHYEELAPFVYNDGRNSAWYLWSHYRDKYGIRILEQAVGQMQHRHWGAAYGGRKWASAGEVLLSYYNKDISKVTFVDSVWGLQHNSNIILDKKWATHKLTTLLDANVASNYAYMAEKCSNQVRAIYNGEQYIMPDGHTSVLQPAVSWYDPGVTSEPPTS